jgi:hypothetical protein
MTQNKKPLNMTKQYSHIVVYHQLLRLYYLGDFKKQLLDHANLMMVAEDHITMTMLLIR